VLPARPKMPPAPTLPASHIFRPHAPILRAHGIKPAVITAPLTSWARIGESGIDERAAAATWV
jgi:hypothetical protein